MIKMILSLIPILNAKNDRQIKDGLMRLYKKYNYRIQMGTPRFRNLMGMVMGYDPENGEKADQQTILLGYVCENVVYKKEEKENALSQSGVIGISSIMANWNADFSGLPKTISDGRTLRKR